MKRIDHIIWDWNGTLLDDTPLCIEIINNMLKSRALSEIDAALYQEIFNFPILNYYQTLGFDLSAESFASLAKEFCDKYNSRVQECNLHNGALDVLIEVRKTGATQSILSAHEHSALKLALNHYELTNYFLGVYGLSDQYAASKIERGRDLISTLSIDPTRTVLIGDTIHDHEVASALGVSCLLVSHGHHSKSRLTAVHKNVTDSLDLILELNLQAAAPATYI